MNIYIIINTILSIVIVVGTYVYNKTIINKDSKLNRYECGVEEYEEKNIYTLLYYKIAVTYLVFDIETILLFPTSLLYMNNIIVIVIYIFIIILLIGLILEYIYDIYN